MGELIRWLIACIVFALVCFIIAKTKGKLTKKYIILSFISVFCIFSIILFMIPIEDMFFTFKTPEDAYKFENLKRIDSNSSVIEGEKSIFVFSKDKVHFYSKCNKGIKLGTQTKTNTIYNSWQDEYEISVIQYGDTNDYYIYIMNFNGKKFNITDSLNTEFINRNINYENGKYSYYGYIGYINNLDESYYITLDDKKIELTKKTNKR